MEFGRHALIDIYDINNNILDNVEEIKKIISESCKEANLTIVNTVYQKFYPVGISGVAILKESHITIHTWPENNFASVDAFTCGCNMNPSLVCEILAKKLESNNYVLREYKRGARNE